mgnify:CR=1 FL=1
MGDARVWVSTGLRLLHCTPPLTRAAVVVLGAGFRRQRSCGRMVSVFVGLTCVCVNLPWIAPHPASQMRVTVPTDHAIWLQENHKEKLVWFDDVRKSNHIWTHSCPELKWPDEALGSDWIELPDELQAKTPWK